MAKGHSEGRKNIHINAVEALLQTRTERSIEFIEAASQWISDLKLTQSKELYKLFVIYSLCVPLGCYVISVLDNIFN